MDMAKKPEKTDWTPERVLSALRVKRWSLNQLALANGYSAATVMSLALRRPYPKAEGIIANAIGVHPAVIWPTRYEDGKPNRRIGRAPLRPDAVA